MTSEHSIVLPNSVQVEFYPEKETLDRMLELANTADFVEETEAMKALTFYPPMSLLVYDDFLALGLYLASERVVVGVRDYLDHTLLDWVDIALSLRLHPIRVVEKTSEVGRMFERIEPRTQLDWLEYDPVTQVIREKKGVSCPAERFLQSKPPTKDLYSLAEYDGGVEACHMRINDNASKVQDGVIYEGLRCEGQGMQKFNGSVETVNMLLEQLHPEALVMKEPLNYCSIVGDAKPFACLAVKFEQIYAHKIGFDGAGIDISKILVN